MNRLRLSTAILAVARQNMRSPAVIMTGFSLKELRRRMK